MNKVFQVQLEIAGRMGSSAVAAFSSVSAQMNTLGAQSAALRGNLKTLDAAYKSGVLSVESYKNAQAQLKAQLEKTQTAQSNLKGAQARYNEANKRASEVRGRIVDTAITAAPMVAATNAAINFETAMNGVAKQVQGARDDNLQLTPTYYAMQQNIMTLSRDMHMLPSVVADTTAAAARMGVQGAEALDDFVRMSIQMGVAFEGSGDQIAEQMAKIANIRGIKIDTEEGRVQIRDLADTINYLDDQTTAKGPEIIEALQRISGTAAQSTFSNNELAALATTMIDLGKSPEIAATGLNALMNRIATAPSQAKSFQTALASLGVSAKDLQANYMTDSKGTIFSLLEQINGMESAQKAEVLTGLFGAEYQDDISALAAGMDKLKGNFDLLDDAARKGSMEKEFKAKMQTTQFAIEGVKQSAAETGITLTQTFLPSIQMVAGSFQSGSAALLGFQQQYPGLTNAIMLTTAGLIGFRLAWLSVAFVMNQYDAQSEAIKKALASQRAQLVIHRTSMFLSAGATQVATASQWALNAAMTANPIGLMIVGIAALVAAGYLLYQNWDTVRAFFVLLWNDPKAALDMFVDGARNKFNSIINWLAEKWDWIKSIFSSPIQASVQANATGAGQAQVYANATGGIYNRGTFLTTFAEESAEAAIPLDGSQRAVSLWQKAGEILGAGTGGGMSIGKIIFSPNITGNSTPEIMEELRRQQDDFMEQLADTFHQQARVSYGG